MRKANLRKCSEVGVLLRGSFKGRGTMPAANQTPCHNLAVILSYTAPSGFCFYLHIC